MNCKNCDTILHSESDFCQNCGGKVIRNRLTFRNLFEHISETFFNYDNKLLRTITHLFKNPEAVIGGYINGVRKRYVNPISFFGLALTLVGLEWLFLKEFFPESLNLSALAVNNNGTLLEKVFRFTQDYSSLVMMFSVPLYAVISRTVFFDKKKYNYVEHIVAFTYMMAFLSIVSAIVNVVGSFFGVHIGQIALINLPLQIIYISYCFKKLYSISALEISARAFLSFFVYMVLYILIVLIVLLVIFTTQGKEGLIETLKAFKPK